MTNESYKNSADHHYVVTLDDMTGDAMACTCPHHVHRSAFCKHMKAVDDATADGDLAAFPSEDRDENDDGPRVPGPHIGFDKYGRADHRYWRCEECGRESTDKHVLGGEFGDCC